MATPVFCCGGECGVTGTGTHWQVSGSTSFSTTTVRSGARSLRVNPTASAAANYFGTNGFITGRVRVVRFYIRFATLPTANAMLCETPPGLQHGLGFNASDSKIYPATFSSPTFTFGSSGATVTTGVWYRIDMKIDSTNNPHTIDVQVDGTALTQMTVASAAVDCGNVFFGKINDTSVTQDVFFDDIIISQTDVDYPLGAGYVNHFVPTADGTHNVAGANDFERSNTGTDITNATTTAFQLIDDVPLKSGVVTEYINLIAPPNATDYVEVVFGPAPGISTPTDAPRAVEAIVAYASLTAGTTNNLRIALNDNGSLDDVLNVTALSPGTTAVYARKHYADPPSAASVWTLSGNGNFNNVRMRCFTSDAAPDPFWASAMIEAEFQEIAAIPNKIVQIKQAVKRANTY